MLKRRTNIEEKLKRLRSDDEVSDAILKEVALILQAGSFSRKRIANTISGSKKNKDNALKFDLLDTSRIYHIDQIKTICIDYRLRFLNSKYFKGDIPEEAISKINQLEEQHDIELEGFKIIAPSKLFKLEDKDDPLLFAPIGNDYFYLLHKWGNDLHPLRKLLMWPFKNIINLALLTILISYLFTLLIPDGLFSKSSSNAEFWIIFFFMFKSIASIIIFYGFAQGKNFNTAIWNSKYFN